MSMRITTMLFPGGKRKALTLSYDDGVVQDRRMVALMKQYGIRGTFNLNTAFFGEKRSMEADGKITDTSVVGKEEIAALYEENEVATHAAKHSALTEMGAAAMEEVLSDRRILESIVPYPVTGHAYPFGLYDGTVKDMLRAAGIRYARTVEATGGFDLPQDFLEWNPTCHHDDARLMELVRDFCEKDALFGKPQLFYLWGHTYEFDMNDNWDRIEMFLAYVSGYHDKVWMATNGEIESYISAYRSLIYFADGNRIYNPSAAKIWIECLEKVYEIPSGETISLI